MLSLPLFLAPSALYARVLNKLLQREEWAPVYRISEAVRLPHAATSQHLNYMKRVGLLKSDRRAKEVWYAIADHELVKILDCICQCAD